MCAGLLSGCFASPPQIIALDPNRGSVGVPGDAPIMVQFDRPVVPASVQGRFSVSPDIPNCDVAAAFSHAASASAPCRVVWLKDDTGFTLVHQRAVLAANMRYTFTLHSGFADPEGAVNTVDHQWDITTAVAPVVRSVTPGQGATNVPGDVPLVVTFSTPMDPNATRDAITLSPAVAATRILQNARDRARFLVVPGEPLQPGVSYHLHVGTAATDEHGEPLANAVDITFTAGSFSSGPHAVVLAGPVGGAATMVLTTDLTPTAADDPLATEVALAAPGCPSASGCGAAAQDAPLYTFSAAVLSPNGTWLAVVENDETQPGSPPSLVVMQAATGAVVTSVPGATLPSWSPDGATLAFARGPDIELLHPATRTSALLPRGDPLVAPPVWEPFGELVLLDCVSPAGTEHIDLADAAVLARYPVPSLTGQNTDPVVSPDGSQLAVFRLAQSGAATSGTWLVGIGAGAVSAERRLEADADPLGWTDPGTLLAIQGAQTGKPILAQVSVSGGGSVPVTPPPPAGALSSLAVSSAGRLFAFLVTDSMGRVQVDVESVQGGHPVQITSFSTDFDSAKAVSLT